MGGRQLNLLTLGLVLLAVLSPAVRAGGSAEEAPAEEAPAERIDTSFPGDKVDGADNVSGRYGRSYEVDVSKKDRYVRDHRQVATLVNYMYGRAAEREVALGSLGEYYNEEYQNRRAAQFGSALPDVSPLAPTR